MSRAHDYDKYMDEIYDDVAKQEEFRLSEVANLTEENEKLCGIIVNLLQQCEKQKETIENIKFILE